MNNKQDLRTALSYRHAVLVHGHPTHGHRNATIKEIQNLFLPALPIIMPWVSRRRSIKHYLVVFPTKDHASLALTKSCKEWSINPIASAAEKARVKEELEVLTLLGMHPLAPNIEGPATGRHREQLNSHGITLGSQIPASSWFPSWFPSLSWFTSSNDVDTNHVEMVQGHQSPPISSLADLSDAEFVDLVANRRPKQKAEMFGITW